MPLPEAHRRSAYGRRDQSCPPGPACLLAFESGAARIGRSKESAAAGWLPCLAIYAETVAAADQMTACVESQRHLRAVKFVTERRLRPTGCGPAHRGSAL